LKGKLEKILRYGTRRGTAVLIFASGFFLRAVILLQLYRTGLFGDALAYHNFALEIVSGSNFEPVLAPGLPLWLAACYRVFGESQLVAMSSMLIFHTIFCVFLFLYIRRAWSVLAANLALMIFSFYPAFVFHSVWPLTQMPVAALLICVAYMLDVMNRSRWLAVLPLGLAVGFLILIRPSGILLLLLLPVLIAFNAGKKHVSLSFLTVCVSLIPLSIWLVKINSGCSKFVFFNYSNTMNLYLGNNEYTPLYKTWWFGSHGAGDFDVPEEFSRQLGQIRKLPHSERDGLYFRLAVDHILSRPELFLLRSFNRFRCFIAFDTYTGTNAIKRFNSGRFPGLSILALDAVFYCLIGFGAILYLAGVRKSLIRPKQSKTIILLALLYAAPYWIAFSHPTYHFPVVPLFGIMTAVLISFFLANTEIFKEWLKELRINLKLLVALIFFIYIQIEWISVMIESYNQVP